MTTNDLSVLGFMVPNYVTTLNFVLKGLTAIGPNMS